MTNRILNPQRRGHIGASLLLIFCLLMLADAHADKDDPYLEFDDTMLEEALVYPDWFKLSIGDLNGLPLLNVRDVALTGWRAQIKRAMDFCGALVGLIFLSPFILFIALIIKLDSPGPVFYAQERMGLDARPFWCLKFRSMCADAEKGGPGWTVKTTLAAREWGSFCGAPTWTRFRS